MTTDAEATPARPAALANAVALDRSTRFFYGVGSVAYGIKDNGFGFYLLLYYNQVLGLPASLASAAIFCALAVDALSDPIVGNFSDRLHSRWGRRHPFMYAAALPVALSYWALWNPPELDERGLFLYLLVVAILVRTFITFYEIPSTALAPELSADYDERTRLSSVRHFFAWIGGIGIAVLAYLVLFRPTEEQPVGQLNPGGYEIYGVVGGVLMFAAILASASGTHRHIPHLGSPPPRRPASLRATLRETKQTLSSRSFFSLFGFGIFAAAAGGLVGSMSIYLNTYFWEFRADQIGLIVPSGILSAAVALFLAPASARRFGKKAAAIGTALFAASVAPLPYIAHFAGWLPPNGSSALLGWLILYNIVEIGLIITSTTLVSAMMSDVVEESELVTGRRSEGIFFAARTFMGKSVTGLGIVMATMLLSAIGFPERAQPGEVDRAVIDRLGMIYAPLVIVLYSGAIACLFAYQITRAQHGANLEELRLRGRTDELQD